MAKEAPWGTPFLSAILKQEPATGLAKSGFFPGFEKRAWPW